MLNLYLCNKKMTKWSSRRSKQGLLSSGQQVNRSNVLIRVRRTPQPMELNKPIKTRSAEFALVLSQKEHPLKMGNLTNSSAHASAPVQWV